MTIHSILFSTLSVSMRVPRIVIPTRIVACIFILWSGTRGIAQVDPHNPSRNPGIELAKANLTARVEQIELANDLAQFTSIEAWESQRELLREQLREMLGLPPLESRSMELHAVTTGTMEVDDVVVEKLHFQSSPGVYVTGNLYRPKTSENPLPAVLYVCGHGQVKENGFSLGNKTHYQHHPAWFARHGYISMAIDTIQLGEIEGIHHGLYRHNRWDWPSRGYTPAGVEAWNALRAVDYLCSRQDVDPTKIGITGRSGGGAYSWFTAAIDPRISVVVPVAGITDLRDHVIHQVVRGHCDCMFFNNRYGWDYSTLAAMVHPRALLIGNTDEDPIFPLGGVFRIQQRLHSIYSLGEKSKLGIHWTTGGHEDSQELQLGCFVWFDRNLLGVKRKLESIATPLFVKADLKVFETIPAEERVTTVQDWFVPTAAESSSTDTSHRLDKASWNSRCSDIQKEIRGSVLGRLPRFQEPGNGSELIVDSPMAELIDAEQRLQVGDWQASRYECKSGTGICASLVRLESADPVDVPRKVSVVVADQDKWRSWSQLLQESSNSGHSKETESLEEHWKTLVHGIEPGVTTYLVFPEGRGPWTWDVSDSVGLHWRRSYLLVGWSFEGRQVAGISQSVDAILRKHQLPKCRLVAESQMSTHALHAALLDPDRLEALDLQQIDPQAYLNGFVVMGILRVSDIPEVLAVAATAIPTTVANSTEFSGRPLFQKLGQLLGRPLLQLSREQ